MFRHVRDQIKDCIGEFLSEFDRRQADRTGKVVEVIRLTDASEQSGDGDGSEQATEG